MILSAIHSSWSATACIHVNSIGVYRLAKAAQCIAIGPVCGFVCMFLWVCLFVCLFVGLLPWWLDFACIDHFTCPFVAGITSGIVIPDMIYPRINSQYRITHCILTQNTLQIVRPTYNRSQTNGPSAILNLQNYDTLMRPATVLCKKGLSEISSFFTGETKTWF